MNLAFENIHDPPPFTTDEQFNKAVDCIRSFELKEMNYNIKMFSKENNMDPGVVPLN
jgi:hypothetical protein